EPGRRRDCSRSPHRHRRCSSVVGGASGPGLRLDFRGWSSCVFLDRHSAAGHTPVTAVHVVAVNSTMTESEAYGTRLSMVALIDVHASDLRTYLPATPESALCATSHTTTDQSPAPPEDNPAEILATRSSRPTNALLPGAHHELPKSHEMGAPPALRLEHDSGVAISPRRIPHRTGRGPFMLASSRWNCRTAPALRSAPPLGCRPRGSRPGRRTRRPPGRSAGWTSPVVTRATCGKPPFCALRPDSLPGDPDDGMPGTEPRRPRGRMRPGARARPVLPVPRSDRPATNTHRGGTHGPYRHSADDAQEPRRRTGGAARPGTGRADRVQRRRGLPDPDDRAERLGHGACAHGARYRVRRDLRQDLRPRRQRGSHPGRGLRPARRARPPAGHLDDPDRHDAVRGDALAGGVRRLLPGGRRAGPPARGRGHLPELSQP